MRPSCSRLPALRRLRFALPVACVAVVPALPGCGGEDPGQYTETVRRVGQPLEAYCTANVIGTGSVDVETDYLPHVVQCENGGAPFESLKAQAVSARTYLYYKLETSGSIADGTGDQVYTCSRPPTADAYRAVQETSGQFLSYQGTTICAFYVAGAKQSPPACQGATDASTEKYVTYNWGLSGDNIHQTTLGWVDPGNKRNRGCLSQWGSRCLADAGWVYTDILKFYYGMDITLETATGPCIQQLNQDPKGNLDEVTCEQIRGWAQDPDEPDKALTVHVYFDAPAGDPSAQSVVLTAKENRQDLCNTLGSCNHGFTLPLPLGLRDGAPHTVYVYAIDTEGGNNPQISSSPGSFTCGPPAPPLTPAEGIRRRINSTAIFDAWKFSTFDDVAIYSDSEIAEYPLGPDLPPGPELARADDGSPEVWLLDTNTRRHVPSPQVLEAWRFDSGSIATMPAATILALPQTADVRPQPFLMRGSDETVYLLDSPITVNGEPPTGDPDAGAGGSGGSSANPDAGPSEEGGAAGDDNPGTNPSAQAAGEPEQAGCDCSAARGSHSHSWLLAAALLGWVTRRRSTKRLPQ